MKLFISFRSERPKLIGNLLTIYEAISVSFPVFIRRGLFIVYLEEVAWKLYEWCLIFIDREMRLGLFTL